MAKINKTQFVDLLQKYLDDVNGIKLSKKDLNKIIGSIFAIIYYETVINGNEIMFKGFGKFFKKKSAKVNRFIPSIGKRVLSGGKEYLSFKGVR